MQGITFYKKVSYLVLPEIMSKEVYRLLQIYNRKGKNMEPNSGIKMKVLE